MDPQGPTEFPMSEPKGTIRADVSEEAVEAALRAVEAHEQGAEIVLDKEASDGPEIEILGRESEPANGFEALEEGFREKERHLEEQIRDLSLRLQEASDLRLRAAADLENFKKRAQREKEDVQRFGIERLLTELLPILDNFDRAIAHGSTAADVASFAVGVEMTRRVFEDTLAKFGVKAFSALGEAFDPHRHEAIQQISHEEPVGTVVQELVRGYLLHDRLVRPAMVAVSSGPAEESRESDEAAGTPGETQEPVVADGGE